jgi:TrpR-related protein YerC/YecD
MATDETWRTEEINDLFGAILRLESVPEAERFFRDLCTLGELRDMAQRWAVVRMLDQGLHYAEISHRTGASTATITRIASWLHHGEGGYRLMLERTSPGGAAGQSPAGTPAGSSAAGSSRPGGAR